MSNDYKLQANVKLGSGYDAHLINITGGDPGDFANNLIWVKENAANIVATVVALEAAYGLKELAPNIAAIKVQQEAQQGFQQAAPAYDPPSQLAAAPSTASYQHPGVPATAPAAGAGPSCRHGAMTYRPAGVAKRTGRAYNAFWSCPSPNRAEQCKSQDA